jgi:hypothetical protein
MQVGKQASNGDEGNGTRRNDKKRDISTALGVSAFQHAKNLSLVHMFALGMFGRKEQCAGACSLVLELKEEYLV